MIDLIILSLLLIFSFLLATQLLNSRSIEGLESKQADLTFQKYRHDDDTNTNALSIKNSSNIEYLVQKLEKMDHLKNDITDLTGKVTDLTNQVKQLVQAQKDYTKQTVPDSPPDISGT